MESGLTNFEMEEENSFESVSDSFLLETKALLQTMEGLPDLKREVWKEIKYRQANKIKMVATYLVNKGFVTCSGLHNEFLQCFKFPSSPMRISVGIANTTPPKIGLRVYDDLNPSHMGIVVYGLLDVWEAVITISKKYEQK